MVESKEINKPSGTLILEGGAMRGIFTAGVLDAFMDRGYYFPQIVAISAGTLQALCYLSRQKERNKRVNLRYANDRRYMGIRHLIRGGDYFNFSFIFGELAENLMPFDKDTFMTASERMLALVTSCDTGKITYISNKGCTWDEYKQACEASCSIPLFSKPVQLGNKLYVDGGVGIPLAPLPEELPFVTKKPVYILTRDKNYRKKHIHKIERALLSMMLGGSYPKINELMATIPERYNEKVEELLQREKEGRAFIIRPEHSVHVSRTERNIHKLRNLYEEGRRIGESRFDEMLRWLCNA